MKFLRFCFSDKGLPVILLFIPLMLLVFAEFAKYTVLNTNAIDIANAPDIANAYIILIAKSGLGLSTAVLLLSVGYCFIPTNESEQFDRNVSFVLSGTGTVIFTATTLVDLTVGVGEILSVFNLIYWLFSLRIYRRIIQARDERH